MVTQHVVIVRPTAEGHQSQLVVGTLFRGDQGKDHFVSDPAHINGI